MSEAQTLQRQTESESTLSAPESSIATSATPPPLSLGGENGPQSDGQESELTSDSVLTVENTPGTTLRQGTSISVNYSVPLDKNNIQASAGETMIFGVVARDTGSSGDNYVTNYSVTGPAEFDTAGSGTRSKQVNGLVSRNVYLITNSNWQNGTITVTSKIRNTTQSRDEVTIVWTVILRSGPGPTGLRKIRGAGGTAWAANPSVYTYKATPDRGNDGRADYTGQTVLEAFGTIDPLFFNMADLKDSWKQANPSLNTPTKVARHIWDSGGNGTFVFDSQDRIADRHGGFGDLSPFKTSAFADANGVGYRLPQEYKIGSTTIASCNIDRRYTTANGVQIRKSDPV